MSSYVSIPVDDPPPVSHLPRPPPLPFSDQQQQQPQPMEPIELPPPLTEERFMEHFMLFSHATGIRLNEQDFYIEGQQVNPWALHRAVFARNGFDSVTAKGEWPLIGAVLGFPQPPQPPIAVSFSPWAGDPTSHDQLADCAPAVAHRLKQLYQDTLRHFDRVYISSSAVLRSRTLPRTSDHQEVAPLPQATEFPPQPTETDHQTPSSLNHVPSEYTSGDPRHAIFCAEQNPQHVDLAQLDTSSGVQAATHHPLQPTQNHLQQQQQEPSVRELMGGGSTFSLQQQQIVQDLRMKVLQGVMSPQQARESLATMQTSLPHVFPERSSIRQLSSSNQISPYQQIIRAQDPSYAYEFGTLVAQDYHQQQNGSGPGFDFPAGQKVNYPGLGHPQGHASSQQSFVQSYPSAPPGNAQCSSMPSAMQALPLAGQQVPVSPSNSAELPFEQLRLLHTQMLRIVMEGEKSLQTSSTTGPEGDIQRQQLRAKLDVYKQRLQVLQEIITAKMRARSDQHYRTPVHQVLINEAPHRRSFPSPQQNPVSIDIDLLLNGTLTQVAGAPAQQSSQIIHPLLQQPSQTYQVSRLSEERFKSILTYFSTYIGFGLCERDFIIDGKSVSPLALHKAVFLRNGFESVCTYDEWPIIGAVLGYSPSSSVVDTCQPARCGPKVAQQLQQLYHDVLRHFDQAYINRIVPLLRDLQTSVQVPFQSSQQRGHLHLPTEVEYELLLANVISDLSLLTAEVMSILTQFASTSCVELEAHCVLKHIIETVVQNRTYWQVSLRVNIDPSLQSIQDSQQRQRLRQYAIASGIAHNMVQLTAQGRDRPSDMMASNTSPGSTVGPFAGTKHTKRPSREEVAAAKRWTSEQKRVAFAHSDGVASHSPIPESDIPEYRRNLERLDEALCKIEKYIHIAFVVLKKEDVVQRMFTMMASTRAQLEELGKTNPRYVLELHTIRGMIQEADNMDKGLKAALGVGMQCPMMAPAAFPSGSQVPPRPHFMEVPPQFTQPMIPTTSKVDHGSSPSPQRATNDWEDLFGEEVRIAMGKLRI